MGLNGGTLHCGIAQALAAVAAVLSTACRSSDVSLSRVACCYWRAVISGVWGESSSHHGYHECQIAVHWTRTVVRCWFIPDDSICLRGVASAVSVPVSDRTLDVRIDHLRDLDLPVILARMADRSEP